MGQQRVSRLRSQQRKRMSKETRKSPPTRASEASLSGGALISFFSVYPQSRPCLCGEQSLIKIHHRGTENTEDAQRLAQTRTLPTFHLSSVLFRFWTGPIRGPLSLDRCWVCLRPHAVVRYRSARQKEESKEQRQTNYEQVCNQAFLCPVRFSQPLSLELNYPGRLNSLSRTHQASALPVFIASPEKTYF